MAQYSLAYQDSVKIFFVNRSTLDNRIDPIYYNSVNELYIVNNTKHPILKLGEVTTMQRGRFGHRPRNDPEYFDGQYPFIQTGNVVEASKSNGRIKYTQTLNELGLSTSRLFQPNVLVITIAANIGDTAILDYPACFPDSLIALHPKGNINIYYLNYYLKFIKSYIESLAPQSAQKNINLQQLNPIPVIVPPKLIQEHVVEIMTNAYNSKQQKESEAKALLESIDSYLLKELGITLPEKTEVKAEDIPTWMNSENLLVKNGRLFMTSSREIIGQRLDPKPYDTNTKNLKQAIANCKTKSVQLKSLIIHSCAGDWGTDETEAEENQENKKCLVIRATEFDNKYNLNLDNTRVKYRLIKQRKLTHMDIQANDLLIEKSGGSPDQPVGRIALLSKEVLNNNTHIGYSNFIYKIRIDSLKVNPEYLFYFLKTMHNVKLTETMQSQTNGIRNLIMTSYLTQNIPLPEKDKQETIIQNISKLLTRAQQLENEAIQILTQAKSEIEQMILGE